MLLERPGEVVTRQQLNARLWPNGTVVEFDHGINSCIHRLRAALNDSAEQPRFIETLPKRGYRFIFPCESFQNEGATAEAPSAQYRIGAKLGAGAMGVVYRATDTRLGRDVALKFPVESILSSPRLMDAFEREARAAAALNHPNICTVHCVGEQDGRPFIAMELLEGETLEAILNRRELGMEEVVSIAAQLAAAMDGSLQGHHPSRYQAGQHLHIGRQCSESRGFWHIQMFDDGAPRSHSGRVDTRRARNIDDSGYTPIHGAGTVGGPDRGCAIGHLLVRRDAVRDDRPAATVRRRHA